MVTFESGQYSVPHQLLGATVWVRAHGVGADEQVVIVHVGEDGPLEVARHRRATPGTPKIDDEHFPPQPVRAAGPSDPVRRIRPTASSSTWARAPGCGWSRPPPQAPTRCGSRWPKPSQLAKLFDPVEVDWALGHAAVHGRFAEADLSSILDHHARAPKAGEHRASEDSSLTQGTSGWARLGQQVGQHEAAT
jgi:hypothetical protein